MENNLQVLPLKDLNNNTGTTKQFELNPILMGCSGKVFKPFLLTVCAPVRSGKSVLLTNLILNPNFGYKEIFDRIFVISPTILND